MGWDSNEETPPKKRMDLTSKILIGIIACVILIIILISILLFYMQVKTFRLSINGESKDKDVSELITKIDGISYIQIEEFAELVGYEYHKGEYKSFTIEEDMCYVQGADETATFYLNDNKVCKLPVNEITEDYRVYDTKNTVKEISGKMCATIDAIEIAFNVKIQETEKSLSINTLEALTQAYDKKMKEWGYSSISDQSFENKKSILYGYIVVQKESSGLYKIINLDNTKEIVSDKYNSIEFIENTEEFFVTNSLGEVGIINLDGTTKIEPEYDSIEVLDKKSDLYLIQEDEKYGVVKSGNITIIYPEYDSIGLDIENYSEQESKYILLDTLIPVCKGEKYGAFDKEGNIVYKVEYDGFGCASTEIEIEGVKKSVNPVLTIEKCKGVVVQKEEKYGIKGVDGKDLVSITLDSIYSVEDDQENTEYYMLYKTNELNIIDELIKAGLVESETTENEYENTNTIQENTAENNNIIDSNINSVTNNKVYTNNVIE